MTDRSVARKAVEIVIVSIGLALLVGSLAAQQHWLDQHFMPILFLSRQTYVLGETLARLFVGVIGVMLVFVVRPRLGKLVARMPVWTVVAAIGRISLAVVLAIGTSELGLRYVFAEPKWQPPAEEEPRRQLDPHLGWVLAPGRGGHAMVDGRVIDYAFDAAGYRVKSPNTPVDVDAPAILFTGESIMLGLGLRWEETIPARVGTLLGMHSANLAVSGYANDQAYMRLAGELPRFRRPEAVVALFMPVLFDRTLDDDRPHLGLGLEWLPAVQRWRIAALVRYLVPYRSHLTIERGIAALRAVLCAEVALARARHAVPLIVVPQFGKELPMETTLRRRILDEAGLPYVEVALEPSWKQASNSHPNAHAAEVIATAIANRLTSVGFSQPDQQ